VTDQKDLLTSLAIPYIQNTLSSVSPFPHAGGSRHDGSNRVCCFRLSLSHRRPGFWILDFDGTYREAYIYRKKEKGERADGDSQDLSCTLSPVRSPCLPPFSFSISVDVSRAMEESQFAVWQQWPASLTRSKCSFPTHPFLDMMPSST